MNSAALPMPKESFVFRPSRGGWGTAALVMEVSRALSMAPGGQQDSPRGTRQPYLCFENETSDASDLAQRLLQVGDQVAGVLDADRQPDQAVDDADAAARLRRDRGVGHDRRVLDQALHPAQALREREQLGAFQHL